MQQRRNAFSRRNFVGALGASALAAPALTTQQATAKEHAMAQGGEDEMTADEMDEMHRISHQSR